MRKVDEQSGGEHLFKNLNTLEIAGLGLLWGICFVFGLWFATTVVMWLEDKVREIKERRGKL